MQAEHHDGTASLWELLNEDPAAAMGQITGLLDKPSVKAVRVAVWKNDMPTRVGKSARAARKKRRKAAKTSRRKNRR